MKELVLLHLKVRPHHHILIMHRHQSPLAPTSGCMERSTSKTTLCQLRFPHLLRGKLSTSAYGRLLSSADSSALTTHWVLRALWVRMLLSVSSQRGANYLLTCHILSAFTFADRLGSRWNLRRNHAPNVCPSSFYSWRGLLL